jgi:hypothetical protein
VSNQIKRSMLKAQYARFVEAWNNERRYQQYLLESGQPLPAGHNKLGKKPTFSMWMAAVKNRKIAVDVNAPPPAVAEAKNDEKQVEVTDKEW